jgi:hypothetical protein
MKITHGLAAFLGAVALLAWAGAALAQQDNTTTFAIAPPPLSYPDYTEPGTSQHKLTGTYLQVEVEDFELSGIGAAYSGRLVLDKTAGGLGQGVGFAFGFYVLSGSGNDLDLAGIVESLAVNYEIEVAKSNGSNAILFVGPAMSIAAISGTGTGFELEAATFLFGAQLGGQVTVTSGDVKISPWAMYQTLSGSTSATATVRTSQGTFTQTTDTDVTVSTTSLGFDILHVPSGVTLSGLMQNAGGDSDAKVTILSFSYSWGGAKSEDQKSAGPLPLQRTGRAMAAR